jgi:hypothetical protein
MAKKHMKKYSPTLAIKEIQIKTAKIPPHLLEWLSSRPPPPPNAGEEWGERNPHTLLVGM